jgi:CHAT domain-containing protein
MDRKRAWVIATACCGIAGAAWLGFTTAHRARANDSDLAAALGHLRFVEVRLSGGLGFAPCATVNDTEHTIGRVHCSEVPVEGSAERRRLFRAFASIRRAAGNGPDGVRLAAASVVAWPGDRAKLAVAVDQIQALAGQRPLDASLLNDLSAARFVLAVEDDEPEELVRALAAADAAFRVNPSLSEACFNRAVIAERLYLQDLAAATWDDYLRLDSGSEWADEARVHRARLRAPSALEVWREQLPRLAAAAQAGDTATVRNFVSRAPQEAREHALEALLGHWGDLVLAGRAREATYPLQTARAIGEALLGATGEPTVHAAVQAVDRAMAVDRSDQALADLAEGYRDYRDGMAPFREQALEDAAPRLEEARKLLARTGSQVELWALLGLGGVDLLHSHYSSAMRTLQLVSDEAVIHGSRVLAGRAEWAIGLALIRQGKLSESLRHYQAALHNLAATKEMQSIGAVDGLIAENLRVLGQTTSAWRHRLRAAGELHGYRDSIRLHNVMWEGGWAALEEGYPGAALLIQNEGLHVAERSHQNRMVAEALIWRSKIELALGDVRRALENLSLAERLTESSHGDWARERVAMDIAYAEGEAWRHLDPTKALRPLTRALDFYRARNLALDLAAAYLSRGRSFLAAGQDRDGEADLEAAMALFEQQRGAVAETSSRLSFSESAQQLFDEMILLKAQRQGNPGSAFSLSERARAAPLSRGKGKSARVVNVREILAQIPENTALIEYAQVESHLFVWVLRRGVLDFVHRSISPERLRQSVQQLVSNLQNRVPEEKVADASSRLYEILLPGELGISPGADLCFVPDKILNAVPFAALRDPIRRRYLIEDHAVFVAPSVASFLSHRGAREAAGRARPWRVLLVGATQWDRSLFPGLQNLPRAASEIAEIRAVYPVVDTLLDSEATRDRLLGVLERYDVLHVAAHALFNPRHPEHSYILFAPSARDDGVLFGSDVMARNLRRIRLVVLAACDTIGPLDSRTSGISGLARPFLDGGAAAVLGTLWKIDDVAAERMMPEFHRRFLETRNAPLALRDTQLALLRSPDPSLRNPGAWAGFQLIL